MHLNFVTPLPPQHTEIANHSALVLSALTPRVDVTVWTDQPVWNAPAAQAVRRLSTHDIPVAELAGSQATFFNIGNNVDFHATIWEASRRAPGVVILHDTYLQNLFNGMANSPGRASMYIGLMHRFHGEKAAAEAAELVHYGRGDLLAMMQAYPLTEAAIEGVRGVVVHNPAEVARLQRLTAAPVWHIPLAGAGLTVGRRPGGGGARNTPDGARRTRRRLVMFGHIGPNRRLIAIIEVLATSSVRDRYTLDIYGHVSDADGVAARIAALGLTAQVKLRGFVSDAALAKALEGADLALNLRQPSLGEASSSQLRIWANALPSLVTRAGWYEGLSGDCVGFVRPEHEADDLEAHLVAFAQDAAPYVRQGLAGQAFAMEQHTADGYADALLDIAAELGRGRAVAVRESPGKRAMVYLDVTDLLVYSAAARVVSGIQRVQIGLIANWLRDPARAAEIRFLTYLVATGVFHDLDTSHMAWLVETLSGGPDDFDSRVARLQAVAQEAEAAVWQPRRGDVLLVTGSFWSFPGFHAALRRLQAETALRYVQLFYDAVPTFVPETVPPEAVTGYNRSLAHMLSQADAALAISHYSAGELRYLANALGFPCPPTEVVPLGTDTRYAPAEPEEDTDCAELPPGLDDFVLCVGTIEPRKNHLYLFHLWRRLLTRARRRTPVLVCAGRMGWLTDDLRRHLGATANLDGHFVILPGLSDAALRALYRRCRFTIYPSIYEGWGLPVSESLSEGRLCVTSAVSAMPEAGGKWAAYLDPYDLSSGFDVVSNLLDHPEKVRAMEAAIRGSYSPVSWAQAADTVWGTLERMVAAIVPRTHADVRPLVYGAVHRMTGNGAPHGTAGPLTIARAEAESIAFGHVLDGIDWHPAEHWGAWAAGPVARLRVNAAAPGGGGVVLAIRARLPDASGPMTGTLAVDGREIGYVRLSPGAQTIAVPLGHGGRSRLELVLDGEVTVPGDGRRLGLGFHGMAVCRPEDEGGLEQEPGWGTRADWVELRPITTLTLDRIGTHETSMPARTECVRLLSQTGFAPGDDRRLGVAIREISVDGVPVPLSDPALHSGFHELEGQWRWTNGAGQMALEPHDEAASLVVTVVGLPPGHAADVPRRGPLQDVIADHADGLKPDRLADSGAAVDQRELL